MWTRVCGGLLSAALALNACSLSTDVPDAAGPPCSTAIECPGMEGPCAARACIDGKCVQELTPAGEPTEGQTANDCLERQCDGMGEPIVVADEDDVLDDGNPCTASLCSDDGPVVELLAPGETCEEMGICDGAGHCVACIDAVHCAPDACTGPCTCEAGKCVPEDCTNGEKDVQNGETDLDCGGPCTPCADFKECLQGSDCLSLVCGPNDTCSPATCEDEVKNSDETDVDCGGNCVAEKGPDGTCRPGENCADPTDCSSLVCDDGPNGGTPECAAPSCKDLVKNGKETDVDCGGQDCMPCGQGQACLLNSDCTAPLECDEGRCLLPPVDQTGF